MIFLVGIVSGFFESIVKLVYLFGFSELRLFFLLIDMVFLIVCVWSVVVVEMCRLFGFSLCLCWVIWVIVVWMVFSGIGLVIGVFEEIVMGMLVCLNFLRGLKCLLGVLMVFFMFLF